jgi:transposase
MPRIKKVKNQNRYADDFKRKVALEYLSGRFSYAVAAEEYGLSNKAVVREFVKWYRQKQELSAVNDTEVMAKSTSPTTPAATTDLQKQIKELEAALRLSNLKVEALETMIDIAEDQLQIDIRKKSGSQRLKK